MKGKRLKGLRVKFISLVDKGANNRPIVLKDEGQVEHLLTVSIAKVDEELRKVYGIVYPVNEKDAHGDWALKEDLWPAQEDFMKNMRLLNIDRQHNMEKQEAFISESWIVRAGDPMFPEAKDVDAWAVAVKIEDDKLWADCKSGKIGGLSLYGTFMDDSGKSLWEQFKNWAGIKKTMLDDELRARSAEEIMWAFQCAIRELIESQDESIDKEMELAEMLNQLGVMLSETILMKSGAVLSQSNRSKLESAIESLRLILEAATSEKSHKGEDKMDEKQVKAYVDEALAKQKQELEAAHTEQMAAVTKSAEDKISELEKKLAATQETVELLKATILKSSQQENGGGGEAVSVV